MALPTWVDSINGHTGSGPLEQDPMITLDSADIRITGSTGKTVKGKFRDLASAATVLEMEQTDSGDYRMRIGSYRLTL